MISPKLLQSNVLRRIYKDSAYEATKLRDRSNSQFLAGDKESSDTLFEEGRLYGEAARACLAELQERKESLN